MNKQLVSWRERNLLASFPSFPPYFYRLQYRKSGVQATEIWKGSLGTRLYDGKIRAGKPGNEAMWSFLLRTVTLQLGQSHCSSSQSPHPIPSTPFHTCMTDRQTDMEYCTTRRHNSHVDLDFKSRDDLLHFLSQWVTWQPRARIGYVTRQHPSRGKIDTLTLLLLSI